MGFQASGGGATASSGSAIQPVRRGADVRVQHRAVRPLREKDLPAVAALWREAFQRPSVAGLPGLLREVFLEQPFQDPDLPSLVHEGPHGVDGFVGVLPRPMRLGGRRLRAAIASQLMVAPGGNGPFAAVALMRTLLAGPQALTWSDGANDAARRLWVGCGGDVARLYCYDWVRVLRPATHLAVLLARRRPRLARRVGAFCRAADRALALLADRPLAPPPAVLDEEHATAAAICELAAASPHRLRPDYDPASLEWLLRAAARSSGHGELRRRLCLDRRGVPVGWYVYYARRGGPASVLQIGGRPQAIEGVLANLLADAWRHGATAVTGQADPRFLGQLGRGWGFFACRSLGALVHARDPEVLAAVHRGDADLTRLDGEWWLPFAGLQERCARPVVGSNERGERTCHGGTENTEISATG